jgi:hypothetical protein
MYHAGGLPRRRVAIHCNETRKSAGDWFPSIATTGDTPLPRQILVLVAKRRISL